jgi:hypothetical protein
VPNEEGIVRRKLAFLLAVSICGHITRVNLWAQVDSDLCSSLLQHGLYDRLREQQASSSATQFSNSLCSAYERLQQDKKGGGAKVSYGLASGSASFNSEQLEYVGQFMCTNTFYQSASNDSLALLRQTINPAAVDAWKECISQANRGLKVKTYFREEDQALMTLEISYTAPIGALPFTTIDSITSDSSLHCDGTMKGVMGKRDALGTQSVAVVCTRDISDQPFQDTKRHLIYAKPATITVMTASGTISRTMGAVYAGPPPTPLVVPVGTIIPFYGPQEEAEKQVAFGWWICDGRTVTDPLAPNYDGKATPDLRDKFLLGAVNAGTSGGSWDYKIGPLDVTVVVNGWDDSRRTNTDPRTGVPDGTGWRDTSPLRSTGQTNTTTIKVIPPHTSVVYLIKTK